MSAAVSFRCPKVKLVRVGSVAVRETPDAVESVRGPAQIARIVSAFIGQETQEVFVAVLLDGRNQPISVTEISRGTVSASLVHPRETFRAAIAAGASAIVIAHNHPSGNLNASAEDLVLTERLVEAGKLLGIPIVDHVIVGDNGLFNSFRDRGVIKA
jgi:DNA repair protein RadC